jgi:hypothetical protein
VPALALTGLIEDRSNWSIKEFVRTAVASMALDGGHSFGAAGVACHPERGNRNLTSRSVVVVPAVNSKTVALAWVVEL